MTYLVYRRQIMIEWAQCDPVGMVHNNCFFEFFDTSSWLLFEAALGVRPPDLGKAYDIIGIPLVGAQRALPQGGAVRRHGRDPVATSASSAAPASRCSTAC